MSDESNIKLLNATELIAQTNLFHEIDPGILIRGLKSKYPRNTDEERAIVKSYQDDLRKVLSMERVALKHDRSIASLENGLIKIVKRQGKWDGFESTGSYLEPHEALFMMEMNRLEVYVGKVIVSLERAYHMFLNHDNIQQECDKLTKFEYLVYSHFMRFGCNLRRFKNDDPTFDTDSCCDGDSSTDDDNAASEKSYVWNYLYELLGHRKTAIASGNLDRKCYDSVKQSMNNIIAGVKDVDSSGAESIDGGSNKLIKAITVPVKRKLSMDCSSVDPASKFIKLNHQKDVDDPYLGSGSTNDFMVGNAFQRFKQIFNQIDIIELKSMNHYDDQTPITEKFSFDLWTSLDYRKTQRTGPNFRLIIKQPSKSLPRNDDIFRLYHSLEYKSAIIVVCINEEMSFQAYVYRFTT